MRLGVDIRELERGRATGIGRYVRDFVACAAAARPQSRFFLYGNQRTEAAFEAPNIVVRLARERATLWWDQVVLPRLARADALDVFLSPYIKGPGRVHCPLAVTIHDLMELVFPQYGGWRRRPRLALFKGMARWVGRRAALILTDSQHSREDIERLLGLRGDKIRVLPVGVDRHYHPVRAPRILHRVRERYGIEEGYIFYLGNFKPHKNVEALLRGFAALKEGLRARCQLVLGGRPDAWVEARRRLARKLGIEARTRFIGAVAEEDLPALYSGAALFVFPSLYEGFGLPPLQAMACGTAVVASERTSLPEVVGGAGCLVDPQNTGGLAAAMDRILEDENWRRELEERGLARAEGFRAARVYEQLLRLLEELAAGGGDGR